MEVGRTIPAEPARIFALLSDPRGHVAIDSSGMLQDSTGAAATKVGDEFVIHMDRESLNDYPMGRYDVTVLITTFEPDREIAWTIQGQIRPQIGHVYGYRLEPAEGGTLVTSYYDWSTIDPQWKEAGIFPSSRSRHSAPPWASWSGRSRTRRSGDLFRLSASQASGLVTATSQPKAIEWQPFPRSGDSTATLRPTRRSRRRRS